MRDFEACFGVAVFRAPSVIVQSNTYSAADKAPSAVGIATPPASTVAASALAQEVGSCLPIRAMRCRTGWKLALPLTSRYTVFRPGTARFLGCVGERLMSAVLSTVSREIATEVQILPYPKMNFIQAGEFYFKEAVL